MHPAQDFLRTAPTVLSLGHGHLMSVYIFHLLMQTSHPLRAGPAYCILPYAQRKPMQRCAPPGTPLMWCMFCCLQGFVCLFKKHIYLWITCFLWLNKAWNTIYAFPVSLSMRAIYIKISLHCKHQATETWSFNSVVQSHRTAYTSQFSPNVTAHSSDQLANHRALRFS